MNFNRNTHAREKEDVLRRVNSSDETYAQICASLGIT